MDPPRQPPLRKFFFVRRIEQAGAADVRFLSDVRQRSSWVTRTSDPRRAGRHATGLDPSGPIPSDSWQLFHLNYSVWAIVVRLLGASADQAVPWLVMTRV